MDDFDAEEPFDDDLLIDDFDDGKPVFDKDFLDEDLLDDSFDDSLNDEYDEDYLNQEGFYIEENGFSEETDIYGSDDSFDYED